ncbi:GNAT family N-acetyltransferase [Salinarimonas soli]|uniref:GNAT family N-acetyltransferase n=1 Tax=Salinarimonas soli TaxID=1638099 RepID=A0A5B2VFL1_9HYPH|nr:GNAT family N-acetyltransferase [Salinarimonas soli]KAA2237418.1 GNAT family N-acetyltransferase [Salinarimonas soli]
MSVVTGQSLRIRPAAEADLDAIERIETGAFASDRASRRQMLHAVRSGTILCLVAERDGAVAGYATVEFRRGARVAHLASIAIAPSAAGRGLGRELLMAVEAGSRARGCDRLRLEVRADNVAAQHLYDRSGYARIGEEDDYYEDGSSAWRYEKRLA